MKKNVIFILTALILAGGVMAFGSLNAEKKSKPLTTVYYYFKKDAPNQCQLVQGTPPTDVLVYCIEQTIKRVCAISFDQGTGPGQYATPNDALNAYLAAPIKPAHGGFVAGTTIQIWYGETDCDY